MAEADVTTEMIILPDQALNAGVSLIGQKAAISRFVRETWQETAALAA